MENEAKWRSAGPQWSEMEFRWTPHGSHMDPAMWASFQNGTPSCGIHFKIWDLHFEMTFPILKGNHNFTPVARILIKINGNEAKWRSAGPQWSEMEFKWTPHGFHTDPAMWASFQNGAPSCGVHFKMGDLRFEMRFRILK